MGELQSALDAVAAEDVDALGARGSLDRVARLVRARNRIDAELARTVRHAENIQAPEHDGQRSMAPWLSGHCRLSPGSARRLVRNGRALEQLPAVAAACVEGAVSAEQVAVIAPVVAPGNVTRAAEQGVDLGEVDRVLAEAAATRRYEHLARMLQHYLARLDPDGPEPDPTESRSLTLSKLFDGRLAIRGELDAVGGENVRTTPSPRLASSPRAPGDGRTPSSSAMPWCSWPTTRWPPGTCRSCGPRSRTWS